MRQFDINISGAWITGIFADDLTQATRLAKQVLRGDRLDHREFIMRDGQWIEVKV